MKRIPGQLEDALSGCIAAGHDFELDPLAKVVSVRAERDGDLTYHRLDLYDGLTPLVLIDGVDHTVDIILAVGAAIRPAWRVAVHFERAARAAVRDDEEAGGEFRDVYEKTARKMRRYADALRKLEPWFGFQITLADQDESWSEH